MRKQKCCVATHHVVATASASKLNIAKAGKKVLHVLVVLGVVAYTFFSRIPVDAYFR